MVKLKRYLCSSLILFGLLLNPSYAVEPPALELPDLQGQLHTLKEWQGNVIMLNFWASWCAPCQIEIKDFVKYQSDYADRNLQIVSIGIDKVDKLENVKRSLGINYPILLAKLETGILRQWGDRRSILPYTVLINPQGEVIYAHTGIFNHALFQQWVMPLLDKAL